MTSIRDRLAQAAGALRSAGIESARLDARLLLGHALGRPVWSHESAPVPDDAEARFAAFLARRTRREPVSRIVGRRAFWSLDLEVGPDTLDPRPDSETVVEAALDHFRHRPPPDRVLDLGTGTGCLLLACLAGFPEARGLGVDLAAGAIEVARANARTAGLEDRCRFETIDWGDLADGADDLILCNPPYIPSRDIAGLAPEVSRFDPRLALDGGADGLDAYRRLAGVLRRRLARDGVAVLEIGIGQGDDVAEIMKTAGLAVVERRPDLSGTGRAIVLEWKNTGAD